MTTTTHDTETAREQLEEARERHELFCAARLTGIRSVRDTRGEGE